MEQIVQNLLEITMNAEDYQTREELEYLINDLLTEFAWTINCPSNWRDLRETLIEKYQDDRDALQILDR